MSGRSAPDSYLALRYFDLCSSIISFSGLITAFVISIIAASENKSALLITWNENVLVVPDNDYSFRRKLDTFDNVVTSTCNNPSVPENYDLFYQQVSWGPTTNFTMVPVSTEGGKVDPFLLLIPVLLFSTLFQFFRYYFSVKHSTNNHNKNQDTGGTWIFIYDPEEGPDLWRWIEYSLTSPLQIILIAMVFNARENTFLLLIAALQFALVLFGYFLELQLDVIITEHGNKTSKSSFQNFFTLFYYMIATFFFHITIWSTLIAKYNAAAISAKHCGLAGADLQPNDFVLILLLSQCVAFSLFGLVLIMQTVYILITLDDLAHDSDKQKSMWKVVTYVYSFLSLVAKTFLEYGMLGTLGWLNIG